MIYTITMNPAVDYEMKFDSSIVPNEIMHAVHTDTHAGGKGINCSIVLDQMNIESTVLAFLGGISGEWIRKQIQDHPHITEQCTNIDDENRINVKVHDGREYVLNAKGPEISETAQNDMLSKLNHLKSDDCVMVCGRLAAGMPVTFLYEIADRVSDAGAKLIMDTADLRLEDLTYCRPWLIKPNVRELGALLKKNVTIESVGHDVTLALDKGASNVLLTRGADGAWFQGNDGTFIAKSPDVNVVSTNGAGDSSLAAFVGKYIETGDIREALRWSMAAGTAAVASVDLPTIEDMKKYYDLVETAAPELSA